MRTSSCPALARRGTVVYPAGHDTRYIIVGEPGMQNITVSGQMVRANIAGLQRSGCDWRELLASSGIREEELDDPACRIPIDRAVKLHRLALDALDDETLGLLNRRTPRGLLRQIALSAVHARSLDRALVRLVEITNLLENTFRYTVEPNGNHTVLRIDRIEESRPGDGFIVGWLLLIIHRFVGWLANDRIVPSEINFDFPAPPYHREYYYAYYGAPVRWETGEASILFRNSDLGLPIVQNESSVEGFIRRYPVDLFIPVEIGGSLSRKIRATVLDVLNTCHEVPAIDEVAERMDRHPRTLRRQLKLSLIHI